VNGFDLRGRVRVAVRPGGKAVDFAARTLRRMGVEVVEPRQGSPVPAAPLIVAGDAIMPDAAHPMLIRLWDFQVGMPGTGVQASAASGVSWVLGVPHRPPLYLPADIPEKWCGLLGAAFALSFHVEDPTLRTCDAAPRVFDVAAAEILRGFADQNFGNHRQIPTSWRRNGRISPEHGGIYPQAFFRCQDGYVAVVGRSRQDWETILLALGNPAWATPDLRDPFELARNPERIDALISAELMKYSRDDLLDLAIHHGATFAPVFEGGEVAGRHIVRDDFFEPGGGAGLPFDVLLTRQPAQADGN
jgi:crotonobetainyl-CoA:carnitine CoA-transferase CaiB-like acyl-CoA transferase